jgi:pimeloyl-ACP methyl ester carboxylesterase
VILHADIAGEGPPLVLLHGLFGRGRNLASLARGLSASLRVITLDLRNHGASPHAPGMDYATLAADVLETLAALNATPASLLGHSMGGKAAMACALLAPAAVRRLLVADIAPVPYAHHNRAVAAAMQALALHPGMTRGQAATALAGAVPDPAIRDFLLQNFAPGAEPGWRIGLDAIADAIADIEGWPTALDTLRYDGPTLFVSGGRSGYVTPAGRETALVAFPHAQFVNLADAGHWLHVDRPAEFLAVVRGFFDVLS